MELWHTLRAMRGELFKACHASDEYVVTIPYHD
jgi:hypothetical protein